MPNIPENEAIIMVFRAIAISDKLSSEWVLKGGNALKYVFQSPRASVDLDFTEMDNYSGVAEEELQGLLDKLCQELDRCLHEVNQSGTYADIRVQSSEIKPANVELRENPAFEIKIGYSKKADRSSPYSDVVKLEITLNDIICETTQHEIDGNRIQSSTLNDIIAEKLRALIQQISRNRYRPGDIFDIWFFHTHLQHLFDYDKISDYLLRKSVDKIDRGQVTKSVLLSDDVKKRAEEGFDNVEERVTGIDFPTFEEAYSEYEKVVNKLTIPS